MEGLPFSSYADFHQVQPLVIMYVILIASSGIRYYVRLRYVYGMESGVRGKNRCENVFGAIENAEFDAAW